MEACSSERVRERTVRELAVRQVLALRGAATKWPGAPVTGKYSHAAAAEYPTEKHARLRVANVSTLTELEIRQLNHSL